MQQQNEADKRQIKYMYNDHAYLWSLADGARNQSVCQNFPGVRPRTSASRAGKGAGRVAVLEWTLNVSHDT